MKKALLNLAITISLVAGIISNCFVLPVSEVEVGSCRATLYLIECNNAEGYDYKAIIQDGQKEALSSNSKTIQEATIDVYSKWLTNIPTCIESFLPAEEKLIKVTKAERCIPIIIQGICYYCCA
jgi:hypothetical protein